MAISWEELEDWQKIVIGVFFYSLIFICFFVLFLKPKLLRLKSLKSDLLDMEGRFLNLENEVKNFNAKEKELKKLISESQKIEKQIYKENQLAEILRNLTTKSARGLSVNFSLIEPKQKTDMGELKKVDLIINFSSGYIDMLSYLARVSEYPSFKVNKLVVSPNEKNPQMVQVEMTGEVYLVPESVQIEETGLKKEKQKEKLAEEDKIVNPFFTGESETKATSVSSEEMALPEFNLTGIWGGGVTKAIINGKIVGVGEKVSGCLVKKIEKNQVILDCDGRMIVLSLKEMK